LPADWFEWSNVVECKECGRTVELHKADRVRKGEKIPGVSAGNYKCYHCGAAWRPAECKRIDGVITNVHVICPKCKHKGKFPPNREDRELAASAALDFNARVSEDNLWYPKLEMPDWWDLRRPYNAHIKRFDQFFTHRNLLANAVLGTEIRKEHFNETINQMLAFVFSASLRFTNRMVFRNKGWQSGKPIEWASSTYWLPEVFCEINPWFAWKNRARAVERGKQYSQEEIGDNCVLCDSHDGLSKDATAFVWTGSSTKTPIPDSSMDVIITDPPY